MKKFNLLFIIPLFITSCTTYQTLTVKSTTAQQTNEAAPFTFDNDSVHIEYSFTGQNGALYIKVQNKLDKPIAIDWTRSSLIMNGQAISMANKNVSVSGAAVTQTIPDIFRVNGVRDKTSFSDIHLNAALPQNIDFIPPHSFISKRPLFVLNKSLPNIDQSNLEKVNLPSYSYSSAEVDERPSVKKADYTESSSPLKLDTYLTFYAEDTSDNTKEFICQQNFYVSQLYVSNVPPDKIKIINPASASQFFVY